VGSNPAAPTIQIPENNDFSRVLVDAEKRSEGNVTAPKCDLRNAESRISPEMHSRLVTNLQTGYGEGRACGEAFAIMDKLGNVLLANPSLGLRQPDFRTWRLRVSLSRLWKRPMIAKRISLTSSDGNFIGLITQAPPGSGAHDQVCLLHNGGQNPSGFGGAYPRPPIGPDM
jgi:hypothetical protein